MKIAIDTFGCNHAESGFGSYILYFVMNLPPDSSLEFELFGDEIDRYVYSGGKEIPFTSVLLPDDERTVRLWHYRTCSKFVRRQGYDLVIYPAVENVLPVRYGAPGIAVVNSVISSVISGYKSRSRAKKLLRGLSRASLVVAASEFIRNDLIANGIDSQKIKVIYNGIDHKLFFPSLDSDSDYVDVKPFSIKRPYFVYGSRLSSESKRHVNLIKAFELFKKQTGYPHRLVLAGGEGACSELVHKTAFESDAASDIFLTGHFPQGSFSRLYAGATACIFPAVSEGSGLPVLEAMACGIPVLCSGKGALKEIGGDVPLYFDSDSIEDIAEKMRSLVDDEDLYKKKASDGLAWSQRYNWEETVRQTIESGRALLK